ncbi:MAG: ankyrin repeat domain-containing protein [Endozoicomonas sp.]|uniref:ankyrin repeat domain-containing protein n=1 Tax=Endozoicomonas sp. TaxID=1892382 RepID=UPI003D9B8E22
MVSRFYLRSHLCLYPLLLTFIFLLTALQVNAGSEVISRYLHDINQGCEASSDLPALEHFQENSRYLLPSSTKNEGVCFGMACAYLQAALSEPDSRPTLSQRLQACSRPPESGWSAYGQHWSNLESAVTEALSRYDQFRSASGMPDTPESFTAFSEQSPELADLVSHHVWMRWLYQIQKRQQGCPAAVEEIDSDTAGNTLKMTPAWPMATTRASIKKWLRELSKLPTPAHYLLTTGRHAVVLSIETDHLLLFDQNNPCYFLQVKRSSPDDMAEALFNALLPPLNCENVSISGEYAQVQCGTFKSRLSSNPDKPWNVNNHSFLKAFQTDAVFTVQAVLPHQAPERSLDEADENLEWLSARIDQTFPTPVDVTDAMGVTRLHLASRSGNREAVERLLSSGANPNGVTEGRVTALTLARSRHHQDIIQLLEEKGAIEQAIEASHPLQPELYQRYSAPMEREVSDNLQDYHAEERQRSVYRDSPVAQDRFNQHCAAGGCGLSPSVMGDSPRGFRFRKALGSIGRGEDPVSRFVDRVEQVQDNVVKLFTERHPTLAAISISSKQAAGEFVAEQVDLLDRASGRLVSESWNNLDQNLRDELNGLLKVASVMPGGVGLHAIAGRGKYFQDALAKARPIGEHPNQLMHVLDDGTRILFRKDFDAQAHHLGGPYQGKGAINHYNVQIQNAKGKTIENLHIVPDGKSSFLVWGLDEVIRK